jgi:hypothetical protein
MAGIKCALQIIDDRVSKATGESAEVSNTRKKVDDYVKKLRAVSSSPAEGGYSASARAVAEQQYRAIMNSAELIHISPDVGRGFEYMLARTFAMERRGVGLLDQFTEPGYVRATLRELSNRGEGQVHLMLQHIKFLDDAIEADKVLEKLRKRLRINRNDWHRIKLDAYEIGMQPFHQRDFGIVGAEGLAFLRGRQQRFFNLLKTRGVDQASADILSREVTKVANNYRATAEMLNAFGVKVNSVDDIIRYLPRSLSPESVRRINWVKRGDDMTYDILSVDGTVDNNTLQSVFTKARGENHFVVEDSIVLDEVLRGSDPDIYTKLGVESVFDLLTDTGTLKKSFVEILDASPRTRDAFDALVEVGMVSKLPMTSTELYEYAAKRYKFPFKTIDEFLPYNFEEASIHYRAQAEKLVGRSLATNYTAKAAMEGGWGITEAEKLANPDTYRAYVKLSSVFTSEEMQRYGINSFKSAQVYVHPIVADMYQAQTRLFSDPNQMGFLARFVQDQVRLWSSQALATSGFVFRQLYTPVFQVFAGGGRIDTYASTMTAAIKRIAQLGAAGKSLDTFDDVFDSTRKIFRYGDELVTEQQLWRLARSHGAVKEIIPWLGESVNRAGYKPSANWLEASQRTARYLGDVLDNHKELGYRGVLSESYGIFSNGARRISDQAFHSFAMANVLYDNVGRFALLKDLTNTSSVNRMMRTLGGNFSEVLDFDRAIIRLQDYFPDYANRGDFDQFMRHVRPFHMFMSRNTFATFRMMVRNPGRFMAYQRLFAVMNRPEQMEDVPNGAIPDWQRTSTPMFWVKRDENGDPVEIFSMPRAQFDPVAEGTNAVTGITDSFLSSMGIWPESNMPNRGPGDVIDSMPWMQTGVSRQFAEAISNSYGPYQAAFGFITGEDPRTGYKLRGESAPEETSFLGMAVTPMTRYLAETIFPTLRNINRANPGGVFGNAYEVKEDGTVVPGTPSWAGIPRAGRDRSADFREEWQRMLAVVGFNVYSIDVLDSMGYRESDISYSLKVGYDELNKKKANFGQLQTDRERELALEQIRMMEYLLTALRLDYAEVRAYADERDMDYPAAVRYMRRQGIRAENLNSLTDEEKQEILEAGFGSELFGGVR